MELEEYLKKKGLKKGFFAKEVGISQNALSLILKKKTIPSGKTAQRIVKLTNGEVTFEDLFKERED